jgi:type II secretion system protein N
VAARASNAAFAPQRLGVAGPVALGLLLTFIFMYLRFPYDRLAEVIELRIERATGTRVQLTELGPGFVFPAPGLVARDVRVMRPGAAALGFERVGVRPALSLSWFMGRPALHTAIRSVAGEVRGTLTLGPAPRWSGDLRDFDIGQLPIAAFSPGTALTGRADAEIDIALEAEGAAGSMHIVAREGSLEHPELLMALPFDTLRGELRLGGGQRAEIVSLELESPLVSGSLSGTIGRSPRFETAPLRLEGSFTVSEEIRGVLNAQGADLGSSGSGEFAVTGTPTRPVVR